MRSARRTAINPLAPRPAAAAASIDASSSATSSRSAATSAGRAGAVFMAWGAVVGHGFGTEAEPAPLLARHARLVGVERSSG
jgi:hypothetical protein